MRRVVTSRTVQSVLLAVRISSTPTSRECAATVISTVAVVLAPVTSWVPQAAWPVSNYCWTTGRSREAAWIRWSPSVPSSSTSSAAECASQTSKPLYVTYIFRLLALICKNCEALICESPNLDLLSVTLTLTLMLKDKGFLQIRSYIVLSNHLVVYFNQTTWVHTPYKIETQTAQ